MKLKALITLWFLTLTLHSVFAQSRQSSKITEIRAGENLPETKRISPRTESFISYLEVLGKKRKFSFLTRTLEIRRDSEGREILLVRQRYEDSAGVNTDTSEMLLNTLVPISYNSTLESQTENFDFSPAKVAGRIVNKNGETKLFETPLDEPVYNAVILTEIIQALPLRKNYAVSFRGYNPGKQFFNFNLRVGGSVKLRTVGGKLLETWLVRVEGGFAPVTMWIDKNSGELIKQKVELKDGSEFWRIRLY